MDLLTLFLLGGLWHVANSEVRSFENHAAQDIANTLEGPNKKVQVRAKVGPEALWGDVHSVHIKASEFSTDALPLYTEPDRSQRGILRKLSIDLSNFSLKGLRVESLSAVIPDCRYDFSLAVRKRQIRLSRSGVGRAEVVLTQADLEAFILKKFREVKQVKVRLDRDKVFVDGHGEFLLFEAGFSLVARLEVEDSEKLVLRFARILIDGQPASAGAQESLLRVLNPVIDLERDLQLGGAIQVDRLRVRDGQLRAFGTIHIPNKPADALLSRHRVAMH